MASKCVGRDAVADARVAALLGGHLADPFDFLGPHDENGGRVVRSFQPGALKVEVLARQDHGLLGQLAPQGAGGLFAGRVAAPVPYLLRIYWPGAVQETEDPYSFGLLLGELDLHLFAQGSHWQLAERLGAAGTRLDDVEGVRFAVWAPNARRVSVVGDFNAWDGRRHPMRLRHQAGVWELFVPRLTAGGTIAATVVNSQGLGTAPAPSGLPARSAAPVVTVAV